MGIFVPSPDDYTEHVTFDLVASGQLGKGVPIASTFIDIINHDSDADGIVDSQDTCNDTEDACPAPESVVTYGNTNDAVFRWGSRLEFGDVLTIGFTDRYVELTELAVGVRNESPQEQPASITVRLYAPDARVGNLLFVKSAPLAVRPVGDSELTVSLPRIPVPEQFAFTLADLPENVSVGWTDPPSVGEMGISSSSAIGMVKAPDGLACGLAGLRWSPISMHV